MAADCLAQSRSPWSTSSIFPTWKERNLLCNICCCLFTPVLQCISHAKKFIPRWCLQGAVTFFFCCFYELWISGKQNCYELLYWVWEEEGRGLCRSCFAQIWQRHAVMGAATHTCSKSNQLSEPRSWQLSLINPRPHFSWEKMHEEGMINIMKALGKLLGERRTWLILSLYWKGWRKVVILSHVLQLLSGNWCQEELMVPLRKSSKCLLGIGCPCLFSPKRKLHLWELLMAHAHGLLVAMHG